LEPIVQCMLSLRYTAISSGYFIAFAIAIYTLDSSKSMYKL